MLLCDGIFGCCAKNLARQNVSLFEQISFDEISGSSVIAWLQKKGGGNFHTRRQIEGSHCQVSSVVTTTTTHTPKPPARKERSQSPLSLSCDHHQLVVSSDQSINHQNVSLCAVAAFPPHRRDVFKLRSNPKADQGSLDGRWVDQG